MKTRKKLSAAEKRRRRKAKEERQKKYQWVFMNGKQVRIERPATIDGMDVDEFIARNADPIRLHQNEMWEYIRVEDDSVQASLLSVHIQVRQMRNELFRRQEVA